MQHRIMYVYLYRYLYVYIPIAYVHTHTYIHAYMCYIIVMLLHICAQYEVTAINHVTMGTVQPKYGSGSGVDPPTHMTHPTPT